MRKPAERAVLCWALPALLWLVTWLAGGFHSETNDDLIMAFIARGIAFGEPVGDYSLYFHGLGTVFVWLYRQFPELAWYGLVLYGLLFLATHLAFSFIYKVLETRWPVKAIAGFMVFFFLAGWYEHIFWFNYMRVPFLLAGLVALHLFYPAAAPEKQNGWLLTGFGLLFFVALCIRPGAAGLGLLVVLPVAWLPIRDQGYNRKQWAGRLAPLLIAGGLFLIFLQLTTAGSAATYRRLDTLKSGVLDYQWCCAEAESQEGELILESLSRWFVADPKTWTDYLAEPGRYPDEAYFLTQAIPQKVTLFFRALAFDQFLLLTALLGWWWFFYPGARLRPRALTAVQVCFWLLLLGVALLLKMPPRVLTPALCLFLLVTLAMVPVNYAKLKAVPGWFKLLLILLVAVQFYKITNRVNWQQNQQARADAFLEHVGQQYPGKVVVLADVGGTLRGLSPLRNYDFGTAQVLLLTGWQTLDPHFGNYLYQLTGKREVLPALEALSQQPNTVWVFSPAFKRFLEQYLAQFGPEAIKFKPLPAARPFPAGNLEVYIPAN